jgi:hypothetical protein
MGTSAAALKTRLATVAGGFEGPLSVGGPEADEIVRLAAELEAHNPTPAPAHDGARLRGRWKLLYSSFGLQREATLARLSFNALPKTPVTVTELWQEVDPATGLYDNIVDHREGSVVTLGTFKPASDHRLDVLFTDIVTTGMDPTRVPIDNSKIPPLWSDVVYLDDDFRLNRGAFGNLYVLALVERDLAHWAREG